MDLQKRNSWRCELTLALGDAGRSLPLVSAASSDAATGLVVGVGPATHARLSPQTVRISLAALPLCVQFARREVDSGMKLLLVRDVLPDRAHPGSLVGAQRAGQALRVYVEPHSRGSFPERADRPTGFRSAVG